MQRTMIAFGIDDMSTALFLKQSGFSATITDNGAGDHTLTCAGPCAELGVNDVHVTVTALEDNAAGVCPDVVLAVANGVLTARVKMRLGTGVLTDIDFSILIERISGVV